MRKLSTEYLVNYFKQHGCELLSEYVNKREKVKYRCSCGNESSIMFGDFERGRRCGCGNKKNGIKRRHSLEYVKDIFQQAGCVMLDNEYVTGHTPVRYLCVCGIESKISLASFQMGRRCKQCGIKKNTKPDSAFNLMLKKKYRAAVRTTLLSTGQRKNTKNRELLGYGVAELKEHITNHPNWEKVKDATWHMDHIFPIQAFLDYGISDPKIINALDNLQPLLPIDNVKKKDHYNSKDFEEWLKSKI